MSFLDIDFREQVKMLLPPIMRSETLIDFLSSLTAPLTSLASDTKPYYDEQLLIAQTTSQKMVMQQALNDLFGITASPFIYIVFNRDIEVTSFVFPEGEGIVLYVWPDGDDLVTYVLTEAEAAALTGVNFTVYIPNALGTEGEDRIIEIVNNLKVPGTKFTTVLYV